jgi:hypothetical protein
MVLAFSVRFLALIVLFLAGSLRPALGSPEDHAARASQRARNIVHGTIVIVVSTKDGFVLAGDSRGSRGCTAVPGEFEKVFSFGKRSAIVVAGMIASYDRTGELGEAIATQLHSLDQSVPASEAQPQATTTMWNFVDIISRESSLLDPDEPLGSPIAAASAVSINENGIPEWLTLNLAPVIRMHREGRRSVGVRVKSFADAPASRVQSLGSGSGVVQQLVGLDHATAANAYSQKEIMQKYYSLKRIGKLADLTLDDGKELAHLLVEAAINYAATQPCLGIGGSIDVLTITRTGTEWVQKKSEIAPSPSAYRVRVVDSEMVGSLDGGEWLRGTVPANGTVTFSGNADVRLVSPKFEGPCTFLIGENAQRRMPAAADRLKATLKRSCDVYVQTGQGRVKVSSATQHVRQRPSSGTDYDREYSCLSNVHLRHVVSEFATRFKASIDANDGYEIRQRVQEEQALEQVRVREDRSVLSFKYDLLRMDRSSQWNSVYDSKIVPRASSMQHEMAKRLHETGHQTAAEGGWTTLDMYNVVGDLNALASKLPDSAESIPACR